MAEVENTEEEKPEPLSGLITLEIEIDEQGIGISNITVNGTLEKVIIPQNIISTYNILCVNANEPQDIVFDIKEVNGGVFAIRRRVHDQNGKYAESDFDKIYMNGSYMVKISGAVPKSTMNMKIEVI